MHEKKILRELAPYQQGKQIHEIKEKYGLDHIVKLASNENPYGYSKKVSEHITANVQEFAIYPDGYTSELRSAIASKLSVQENQLLFGSGSDEIVQMISRAFLYPGVNTVMATPTFPQYKHNALVEGAAIKEVPTVDGNHDLQSMLDVIDHNTSVVWLCSPNNPTGSLIPKDLFHSFMANCSKEVVVVLDEAYYEYIDPENDVEAIRYLANYPNLVILRTFSKAYGLAGLRIGYGIANENLITKLDVVRGPFNTTSLAQKAALIALEDDQFIKDTTFMNREAKESFQQFLDSIGWGYYESQTNFLLVTTPVPGNDVFDYLLKHGFIVRPGEGLGCPNTIRLTIGNETNMKELQDLLYKFHLQEAHKEI
ncbi:histidinol-phosphate transaminase [Virgibacillus sp. C22-A2]|uniref:Histidinol-phosphate aminotransferase n=1 Tax=Virgibacillus tibetensis TaxID=3042313 RepID=A0ABU6KAV6_9BACI|nr:histidinol-phosphate transaminase [Virgibacillus sp. C22-A2]